MSANSACVWLLKPCGRRRGQRGNVAEIRRYRTGLLNQRATYFERLMRNGRIRVDDCAAIQELDQETREDKVRAVIFILLFVASPSMSVH